MKKEINRLGQDYDDDILIDTPIVYMPPKKIVKYKTKMVKIQTIYPYRLTALKPETMFGWDKGYQK